MIRLRSGPPGTDTTASPSSTSLRPLWPRNAGNDASLRRSSTNLDHDLDDIPIFTGP